jgi:hypothetical protein
LSPATGNELGVVVVGVVVVGVVVVGVVAVGVVVVGVLPSTIPSEIAVVISTTPVAARPRLV